MISPYRIQYVGNLFVDRLFDHYSKLAVFHQAHAIALLGNIGHPSSPRTADFLSYCVQHWKSVYWVPGPYELSTHFYGAVIARGKTYHYHLDLMRELCLKKGVHLVHQNIYYENNLRILGSTLWAPCHQGRVADKYAQIEFQSIYKTPSEPITPVNVAEWNNEDVNWITRELNNSKEPTLVLTHHLPHPSLLSTNASVQTLQRVGLEVNMLTSLFTPHVRLWLAGSSGSSAMTAFPSGTKAAVNSLYEYPMRTRHVRNAGFSPFETATVGGGPLPSMPFQSTVFYGPRLKTERLM